MNAVEVESVGESPDHRLLPDEILETGGTIFAGEHAIGGRARRRDLKRQSAASALLIFRFVAGFAMRRSVVPAGDRPAIILHRKDPFRRDGLNEDGR